MRSRAPRNASSLTAIIISSASLSAVALYMYIGRYSRYLADDYCYAATLAEKGFWATQASYYLGWSGRFSSVFFTSLTESIGYQTSMVLPEIVIGIFAASVWWIIHQVLKLTGKNQDWKWTTALAATIMFAYLQLIPTLIQSVYWETGMATYTLPLVLATIYANCLVWAAVKYPHSKPPVITLFPAAAGAVIIAGFSETTMTFLTGLLVLITLLYILKRDTPARPLLLPLLIAGSIGAIAGSVASALAPGNGFRHATLTATPGLVLFIKMTVFFTGRMIIATITQHLLVLVMLTIIAAGLSIVASRSSLDTGYLKRQLIKDGCYGAASVVIAYGFICAIFMLSIYAQAWEPPGRALTPAIVAMIGATISLGWLSGKWLQYIYHQTGFRSSNFLTYLALIAIIIITILPPLYTTYNLYRQVSDLSSYATSWDQRQQFILQAKAAGQQHISIARLGHTGGLDDNDPQDSWLNTCMARYYGVVSITAQP